MSARVARTGLLGLLIVGCTSPTDPDGGRFATAVLTFEPGAGAGYGQDDLPDVVLGPPRGGGASHGSTDVLSLGVGGILVLEFEEDVVDVPGPDLLVFENPFLIAGLNDVYVEPGIVSVSADGEVFAEFPCAFDDAPAYAGCAGVTPVYANADEGDISAADPAVAGGDPFDLADVGLEAIRYVRIVDAGTGRDTGDGKAGFDLDAVAAVTPE